MFLEADHAYAINHVIFKSWSKSCLFIALVVKNDTYNQDNEKKIEARNRKALEDLETISSVQTHFYLKTAQSRTWSLKTNFTHFWVGISNHQAVKAWNTNKTAGLITFNLWFHEGHFTPREFQTAIKLNDGKSVFLGWLIMIIVKSLILNQLGSPIKA